MTDQPTEREIRARNYAVKREHGFRCATEGCEAGWHIVVVSVAGTLTTACMDRHAADADHVEPHQFPQSEQAEAELAKQPAGKRRR